MAKFEIVSSFNFFFSKHFFAYHGKVAQKKQGKKYVERENESKREREMWKASTRAELTDLADWAGANRKRLSETAQKKKKQLNQRILPRCIVF